ncbi:MAG: ECF transporter S component [Candidatus Wallbacteria bacterium]|nr:ECF transporter S component [Candidatus Wallbacteria bacterium]
MKRNIRNLVYSSIFLCLSVLAPLIFHMSGLAGAVFLPMHIPVLLCGLMTGQLNGMIVGMLAPMLGFLLTGMPPLSPIPIALLMSCELGAYGFFAGFLHLGLMKNLFLSLFSAMLCGRAVLAYAVFLLSTLAGYNISWTDYLKVGVVTGLPGICCQILLVPLIYRILEKYRI